MNTTSIAVFVTYELWLIREWASLVTEQLPGLKQHIEGAKLQMAHNDNVECKLVPCTDHTREIGTALIKLKKADMMQAKQRPSCRVQVCVRLHIRRFWYFIVVADDNDELWSNLSYGSWKISGYSSKGQYNAYARLISKFNDGCSQPHMAYATEHMIIQPNCVRECECTVCVNFACGLTVRIAALICIRCHLLAYQQSSRSTVKNHMEARDAAKWALGSEKKNCS